MQDQGSPIADNIVPIAALLAACGAILGIAITFASQQPASQAHQDFAATELRALGPCGKQQLGRLRNRDDARPAWVTERELRQAISRAEGCRSIESARKKTAQGDTP